MILNLQNNIKKIAVIICISLACSQVGYAKSIVLDLTEDSPKNIAIRSALLPGWGQFINNQNNKGYVVSIGAGLCVLLSYHYMMEAEKTYDRYEKIGLISGDVYGEYETQSGTSNTFALVAAAFWIYGIVDSYIEAGKKYHSYSFKYKKDGFQFASKKSSVQFVFKKEF